MMSAGYLYTGLHSSFSSSSRSHSILATNVYKSRSLKQVIVTRKRYWGYGQSTAVQDAILQRCQLPVTTQCEWLLRTSSNGLLAAQHSEARHLLSECLSVRSSVRLSHSWVTPKRFKTPKYPSHRKIDGCLEFLEAKFHSTEFKGNSPPTSALKRGTPINSENGPITHQISETVQDRR